MNDRIVLFRDSYNRLVAYKMPHPLSSLNLKRLHHPLQPFHHILPLLREHHAKPPSFLARKLLPIRNKDLPRHQSYHDYVREMAPLQAPFLLRGDVGEEDGFQVYPEEESGVDFWGAGDIVMVEEGGG